MKYLLSSLAFLFLIGIACKSTQKISYTYASDTLKIIKISKHTYMHVSYLATKSFGKVACNGMVLIDDKEAIVFDTPTDDSVSLELIRWIEQDKKASVKAVVINHFHIDCLGGLQVFHERNIPSYANNLTIDLAKADDAILPQHGFDGSLELQAGKQTVINTHFGEGHTKDNLVSYVPQEEVLFGGCLIKSLKSGKGNLADANTDEWSNTVRKIKQAYPTLKHVIPGHGRFGGADLLDYTVAMFEK